MRQPTGYLHPRLTGPSTVVWRGSADLQIGLDDDAIVLTAVPRATEELIRRLDGRHSLGELGRIVPPAWVDWVVTSLAEQGRVAEGPALRTAPTVRVVGTGALGAAVARTLLDGGAQVRLSEVSSRSETRARRLAAMLAVGRRAVDRPVVETDLDQRSARVALTVVATDSAEPDRTMTDLLTRARLTHLVVRVQPGRAVVGPLVQPGRTACLRCADLARSQADPSWPLVACQLARLHVPVTTAAAGWAVSLAVAHTLAYVAGAAPETTTGTLELGDDGLTRFRRWVPHPACTCRGADLADQAARMGA